VGDLGRPLAHCVKHFIGPNQFPGGEQLDLQTPAGCQSHRIRKVLSHIVEKHPLGPGHYHFPPKGFVRGLDLAQFPLDALMPLVNSEFLPLSGKRVRRRKHADRYHQTDHQS
jgi:hypothetical protein